MELCSIICSLKAFIFRQLFHGPYLSPARLSTFTDATQSALCVTTLTCKLTRWPCLPTCNFFLYRLFLVSIVWVVEWCFAIETAVLSILSLLRVSFWSMLRPECILEDADLNARILCQLLYRVSLLYPVRYLLCAVFIIPSVFGVLCNLNTVIPFSGRAVFSFSGFSLCSTTFKVKVF